MGHVGKTVTQNVVSGSEITDGTVTGADLASDIAISTTGAISGGTLTGTLQTASQSNITSVGTLTALTVGANPIFTTANPQIFLNATADGGEGSVNFKDDEGNIDGKIAYRTDYAGNTDNYMTFNTNGSNERMRITDDGKVGISTTSPDAKLDVEGTTDAEVRITRTAASTAGTFNDAGSVLNLVNNVNYENGYNGGASIGQILFTSNDTSTGSGIRAKISCKAETYYHAERLQFFVSPPNTGTGQVSATSNTAGLRVEINSDGTLKVGADLKPAAWAIRGFNNHATHATLEGWNDNSSGKNLNLFRYDGASIFQVSNGGAVWAAGGYTSDKAFKNVIGDCTEGWSKLKDVQPKSYRYKRISNVEQEDGTTKEVFSDDDMDSNIHYGVIAQELKEVLPDITYGEEGKMSVDYNALLMVAINTIKELEARIKALEEA